MQKLIMPKGSYAYVKINTPALGTFVTYLKKDNDRWTEISKKEFINGQQNG